MEYILIFISAIFVNNIVLSQFLGICPFLGVSKKIDTSLGMSAAVAFVLTLATIVTWLVQKYVLDAFGLQYLQTIAFILVIASLVQMVEIVLKKVSPALYQALGIFLPLITTNCAVLGVALVNVQNSYGFLLSVINGAAGGLGFTLAIVLFASLRERVDKADCPECFKGYPITLIAAGLLALAFMGFFGLKIF
jgi:electron transport complex protein RnfA